MSGLSEQEREALLADNLALAYDNMHAAWAQLTVVEVVERIVAAREAQAAERIAQAIDDECWCNGAIPLAGLCSTVRSDMARIAREIGSAS